VGLTSQLGVGVTTLEEVDEVCCCRLVGLGTRTDTKKNTTGLGGGWRSNEGREAGQAWPRSWVVGDSVGRWPTLQPPLWVAEERGRRRKCRRNWGHWEYGRDRGNPRT
jgi:hypothetical protein